MGLGTEPGAETAEPRRFALLLEYDGSEFSGSQYQANARTVQGVLESAVESVAGDTGRVAFAGRTDAGAHALAQTASFLSNSRLSCGVLERALNARLPQDLAVLSVVEVASDFDPRRQAQARHYRYRIISGRRRPVLARARAWFVPGSLDAGAMAEAAQRLLGKRDFAAFSGPLERADASTVRDLRLFSVEGREDIVSCDLVSNAFLPHQVRRMVGALVDVGLGKRSSEAYEGLLKGARSSAGPSAPAHGLFLMAVKYEQPIFAAETRYFPAGSLGLDSEVYVC